MPTPGQLTNRPTSGIDKLQQVPKNSSAQIFETIGFPRPRRDLCVRDLPFEKPPGGSVRLLVQLWPDGCLWRPDSLGATWPGREAAAHPHSQAVRLPSPGPTAGCILRWHYFCWQVSGSTKKKYCKLLHAITNHALLSVSEAMQEEEVDNAEKKQFLYM